MGWAKYYEDNVSICIGRMAVKEYIPVKPTPVRAHRVGRCIEETPVCPAFERQGTPTETFYEDSRRNGRRGLELSFAVSPELRVCRKLHLKTLSKTQFFLIWLVVFNPLHSVTMKQKEELAKKQS